MDVDDAELRELFATSSLGAPRQAVGFVLWRALRRYVRLTDQALAPLGLTHLQFQTLTLAAWITQTGEAVSQSQLARSSDIQPMQLSKMLSALEAKDLITRDARPGDVRVKEVSVTPRGVTALRRALPVVIDVQRRCFGPAGAPGGSLLEALLEIEDLVDSPPN